MAVLRRFLGRFLRLRPGTWDERRPVSWNHGFFPDVFELVEKASETGEVLEMALYAPPRCGDPQSQRERVRILGMDVDAILFETIPRQVRGEVLVDQIFEVRPARG